jgi:hypothetical protein
MTTAYRGTPIFAKRHAPRCLGGAHLATRSPSTSPSDRWTRQAWTRRRFSSSAVSRTRRTWTPPVWLATSIFPRVLERVPDACLDIVGHEPGEEIRALAGVSVSVHASVPDVTPYIDRAAVVVAPIRLGGSMRMKVLEALAAGKAPSATSRASEGVDAIAGEHFLLAADQQELAHAISALLLDRERRRQLGESARA